MARREYDYIKGNTVLAPERKTRVNTPDKKQLQQRKRQTNKNILLKNRRKNDRKYMLTVAVIIIGLGFITISGDIKVYNMQSRLTNINKEIKTTQDESEALKVKILKFSSLNNVQESAKNKLAMFIPSKEETTRIDFSEDYFKDIKPNNTVNNTQNNNLFSKLMNLIK